MLKSLPKLGLSTVSPFGVGTVMYYGSNSAKFLSACLIPIEVMGVKRVLGVKHVLMFFADWGWIAESGRICLYCD